MSIYELTLAILTYPQVKDKYHKMKNIVGDHN
jgi:hypothetical protein